MAIQSKQRVREIFNEASELAAEDRPGYLDKACGDDAKLRAQVEALLNALSQAQQAAFLGQPSQVKGVAGGAGGESTLKSDVHQTIGTVIDRYKILQLIGEGGFGTVYMAEQVKPVRRKVALKIIKLGMDTKQVIARFEAERQALAMMEHPNIARVLDAGETETGRPYFVMELVKGVPILAYCDQNNLTTSERLDLFMDICLAVQHSHQKGIIHRDLKPSNVMVTLHDGRPVPKVIDFGIAKATQQRLTEKTVFTEYGQFIGTPQYMSPEQAEMSGLDIDTRSDIYSLGVLLYELLTGTTPFDPVKLREAGLAEIQRIIREEEPHKPSTRLSTMGDEAMNVAKHRRDNPAHLARVLRGDLDWIIMKALEKDRTRRYETASGLVEDLRRHLKSEPVLASPPSAVYKLRKFVRRNRTGVMAATVVVAALLASTAVSVAFAMSEAAQRLRADEERDIAKVINEFLTEDLIGAVAPSSQRGRGKDVRLLEAVNEAARRIERAGQAGGMFADKPKVEAAIRSTLGNTYRLLGEYDQSQRHLERARELLIKELGVDDPETLKSDYNLGYLYFDLSRNDDGVVLLEKTLERQKDLLGDEDRDTLRSTHLLALLYFWLSRFDDAEPLYRETLDIQRRVLGTADPDTLLTMVNLASLLYDSRNGFAEAESLLMEALETQQRVRGEDSPDTIRIREEISWLYMVMFRPDKSMSWEQETLEICLRILSPEHPDTLSSKYRVATNYHAFGQQNKAERLAREVLEVQRRVLPKDHLDTAWSILTLGWALHAQGRYDEALPLLKEASEMLNSISSDEEQWYLSSTVHLAQLLGDLGRDDEAIRRILNTMDIQERVLGTPHAQILFSKMRLAELYMAQDKHDEAQTHLEEILQSPIRDSFPDHSVILTSMRLLAELHASQDRMEKARVLVNDLLKSQRRRAERLDASAGSKSAYARTLLTCEPADLRDPAKALEMARQAVELTERTNAAFLKTLALAHHLSGDTAKAIETQKEAIDRLHENSAWHEEYRAALSEYEAALNDESP